MFKIFYTPQSLDDLRCMWRSGFDEWGEAQADAYYDLVSAAIERFAEFPEMGRARDEIRKNYRSFSVRRHIIFYTIEDDVVMIQRVLPSEMEHERMM